MRYSPSQPIVCPDCGDLLKGPPDKKRHAKKHTKFKTQETEETEEVGDGTK